jgi:hypothetical protein
MTFDEEVHAARRLGIVALAIGLGLGFVVGVFFMMAKAL